MRVRIVKAVKINGKKYPVNTVLGLTHDKIIELGDSVEEYKGYPPTKKIKMNLSQLKA